MTSETVDERLDRISKELDKILSRIGSQRTNQPKHIILTKDQVTEWLEWEQSFPKRITKPLSDDGYHRKSSDEDLTEPG